MKVSVTIPTLNSAKTLRDCLESLDRQTLKPSEIIVIDGGSNDNTVELAQSMRAVTQVVPGGILVARAKGVELSKAEFVLLLDCDQILAPDTLEKAVAKMDEEFDMLILGEKSFLPKGLVPRLFAYDKAFIHLRNNLDAETGVMLPRFFKRTVIASAFGNIPVTELRDVVAEDHAILFYEASKLSRKITVLPDAVTHIEKTGILHLLKHYYRFGQKTAITNRNPVFRSRYANLMKAQRKPRGFRLDHPFLSLAANLLIIIKLVPYKLGEWSAPGRNI